MVLKSGPAGRPGTGTGPGLKKIARDLAQPNPVDTEGRPGTQLTRVNPD